MRIKRFTVVALIIALILSFMTGCFAGISKIKINEDNSGSIEIKTGLTEYGIEQLAAMSTTEENSDTESQTSIEEMKASLQEFEYNGTTYYGEIEQCDFSNLAELNSLLANNEDETQGMPNNSIEFIENDDKSITLTIKAELNTTSSDMEEVVDTSMLDEACSVLEVEFPSAVRQTYGTNNGITINGNKLTVDAVKLASSNEDENYVFVSFTTSTDPNYVVITEPKDRFLDVPKDAWYYEAIEYMADMGILNGVGNGRFDPSGNITYAQFCKIAAMTDYLDTGSENGYWAAVAIKSCIEAGYIENRGEINSQNYDVPMTREAAVAGLARIYWYLPDTRDFSIPDYDDITYIYKDDIAKAYNSGIINGMDSKGTFKPNNVLTRAEICQMFYNAMQAR